VHLIKTAGVILVAVSVAGAGWACNDDGGGGSSLTLEEYFQEIDDLDAEFSQRSDEAFEDVSVEDPGSFRAAMEEFPGIIGDFVAALEAIDPPEEVQDAHNDAIEAGRDVQSEFERILDETADAASIEDFITAGDNDDAYVEANNRFETACLDLVQVAEDNDIETSLNCE